MSSHHHSPLRTLFIGCLFFLLTGFTIDNPIVFDLKNWTLSFDQRGRIVGMVDKNTGVDYAVAAEQSPLVALKCDSLVLKPVRAVFLPKKLEIELFFDQKIKVNVRVLPKSKYITFEIASVVNESRVDALIWGPYATTLQKSIGETIGIVQGDQFTLGIQALNLKTLGGYPWNDNDHLPQMDIFRQKDYNNMERDPDNGWVLYSVEAAKPTVFGSTLQAFTRNRSRARVISNLSHPRFTAPAYPDGGLVGSKIALFGCKTAETLATIGEIEQNEGLPHPTINGQWVKTTPVINSSYLIMDFTEANMDQCLEYSKKTGFNYLYHGHPFASWGHYPLLKDQFPNGLDGMKKCVEKAESQGVFIGTHTLTNFINTSDPYVSPVPDPRLARVGASRLVRPIDATQTEIEVESPDFFNQMENNNLRSVVVGTEIIRYGTVSEQAPWVLKDCQRGAFGTTAAAHAKADTIAKLMDHGYKVFLGNADLNREIAENVADFMNYTGVRMLDFDGLEGTHSTGMGNYGEVLFAAQWHNRLNDNLKNHFLLGASRSGHYFWHYYSRMNWGEPWYAGFRESQTEYRLKNQKYFKRNLMPGMLGWFKMTNATSTEDIEWLMARSAGFDAGFAFVTDLKTIGENRQSDRIFEIMNIWEKARLSGVFSPVQKGKMQNLAYEFHLEKDPAGHLLLTRIHATTFYHAYKVRQPGEPLFSTFSVDNNSGEQPMCLILTALNGDVSGIELEIDQYKTIALPLPIPKGQTLKVEANGAAVLYDAFWQKIGEANVAPTVLKMSNGKHTLQVNGVFSNADNNAQLKVEVRFAEMPERVGN